MIRHHHPWWWWAAVLLTAVACSKSNKTAKEASVNGERARKSAVTSETSERDSDAAAPATLGEAFFKGARGEKLIEPLALGEKTHPRQSVVLIIADALNARHLSQYGYERPTSPVIDGLAEEGILFTNYVSNSSWTRPSYTTIVTGYPKSRHGVELRGGWRLKADITTLAERFRRAGYRTAGYTGNPLVRKSWGFDQGYQVYEGPTTLGLKAFPRDRVLVDLALDWLEQQGDRPIFLTMFLTSSHPPYRPPLKPRRFLSTVPAGEIIDHPFKEYKKPLPKDDHDRIVAAYDDEIAYMDEQIGRVLEALEKSGRSASTTVVFTADHGEMFGQHNCYLHAYHMWEPVLRVPLIIRSPRIAAKGVIDDTPFTHEDIAPTLLDIAGISYSAKDLKGMSIIEEAGRGDKHAGRVRLSQFNAHGVRRQAARQGHLKLVHHHKVEPEAAERLDELHPTVEQPDPRNLPSLAWDKERYELYDIIADTEELHDLYPAKQTSPEVKNLEAVIKAYLKKDIEGGGISEELLEALKAVGYVVDDTL
jgi:arylsulfatase A-like enzyme